LIGISFHSGGMVDKPLEWLISHLAQIGYDGIEIVCGPEAHVRPQEVTEGQLQLLREELDRSGLRCVAINPYTVKPLVEMEREGGAQVFYRQLIDLAVVLGAPAVNFLPGRFPGSDAECWRALVTALKPLLHYAGERGIGMTIHNHENMILDTPDKVRLIIEEVGMPNLRSLFDATNFHILGSDIPWAVERLAPHLQHCHVKGVIGRFPFHHFLVPGEAGDEFGFRELAASLGKSGYAGYISVETFTWTREDKASIGYEMMRAVLEELGLRARSDRHPRQRSGGGDA
jgi:sugar phosphate isomerase/epimerase